MQSEYPEHANLTVADLEETLRFITTALPSWQVRGRGQSSFYGTPSHWAHVARPATTSRSTTAAQGRHATRRTTTSAPTILE
jgi:hypothetical protein